jgi:hypothetical protein
MIQRFVQTPLTITYWVGATRAKPNSYLSDHRIRAPIFIYALTKPLSIIKQLKRLCMKKSPTYFILVSCFKKLVLPISLFTVLLLLFPGKTKAQAPDPFSRQNHSDFKSFLNPQAWINPQTISSDQQGNTLQWETIQTIVIPQRDPNSPLPQQNSISTR